MKRIFMPLAILMTCCCLSDVLSSKEPIKRPLSPLDRKAAYLANFNHFVYPQDRAVRSPLNKLICVIGTTPIVSSLRSYNAKLKSESQFSILHFFSLSEEMRQCNVLFISHSESEYLEYILAIVDGHPVLTVSDMDRFCESGGMIQLYKQNEILRLQTNLEAVRQQGLKVAPVFLRISKPANSNSACDPALSMQLDKKTVTQTGERETTINLQDSRPPPSDSGVQPKNSCAAELQNCEFATQQTAFETLENQLLKRLFNFFQLLGLALSLILFLGAVMLVLSLRHYFLHRIEEDKFFK